jgi:hypothetical protein
MWNVQIFRAGFAGLTLLCLPLVLPAQQISPAASSAIVRLDGIDQPDGIRYLRLYLDGTLLPVPPAAQSTPPQLIAQCTRSATGKLTFELLANFGGVADTTYYPPWHPTKDDLYLPRLKKVNFTLEFLGYTHVKPVKRQWEALIVPQGQYRYNTPSLTSNNMEDSTYYLKYLLALPTLHLTLSDQTAEFKTTPLLDQIRKEPLCDASHLIPSHP